MKAFVVGDSHGFHELVEGLLEQEGIRHNGSRVHDDVLTVHIGDLCNCVARSVEDDLDSLAHAASWFDVLLVGNHEYPYFTRGGYGFRGFWRDERVRASMMRLHNAFGENLWMPALAVDGVLLTHAGLTSTWGRWYRTAEEAAQDLQRRWMVDREDSVFSACGRARGGWYREGGILWADWNESKRSLFPQVVGHTPGELRQRGRAYCIDAGGKRGSRIGGAWIIDGEVSLVEYECQTTVSSGALSG